MKDDVKNVVKDENLSGSPLKFPDLDPNKVLAPLDECAINCPSWCAHA